MSDTLRLAALVVGAGVALGVIFGVTEFEGSVADVAAALAITAGWVIWSRHRA